MDASIDGGTNEAGDNDLPVSVDTLEIDGIRPKVGDHVDLKVGGTIRKLVDQSAFVTPETVNDQPLPPKVQSTTDEDMMAAAQKLDAGGSTGY